MKNNFILCAVLLPIFLYASENNSEYDVRNIPPGLRKESKLVIRKYINEFQILDKERAVLEYTAAYTIFSKEEEQRGEFILFYNSSFDDVEYIEGYIYDSKGEEIKELDSDDIKDYSDFTGFSLYSDNRIKHAELYHNEYPHTVEFRYRMIREGYLNWPGWFARRGTDPIQLSRLRIKMPAGEQLRYWCNSDSIKPVITDGRIYTWESINLPELPESYADNDLKDYTDYVITAPGEFIMDGHKGSMNTWKEFGLWNEKLFSTQRNLSDKAREEIKKQYDINDDVYTKVKKLYRYMQSRTRYVSISLGIGGWQPFEASFVHEKGYGDCKALSNYMTTLLSIADIRSYMILINTDEEYRTVESFCSNQFNHVIVCVPLSNDTIWLECTNQTYSFNHLGRNNENQMVLIITDEGGKIIYTPCSIADDNKQIRKSEVTIGKGGMASAEMEILWTGNQRDYNYSSIVKASGNEREKRLINSMNVPDIKINSYNFDDEKTISDSLKLNLKADLPRYASVSGNRLFFKPNLTERRSSVPEENKYRISPVRIGFPFADSDTIIYNIPAGYIVETLPQEINIESSFGKYSAKCEIRENKIIYTRYYEINKYEIPAAAYSEYRNLALEIVKSDRTQVVLLKN